MAKRKQVQPINPRSRITSVERVRASDIEPHPGNWRDHPEGQAEAMAGVMREVGDVGVLLAWRSERNGGKLTLIDGHLRRGLAPEHEYMVAITDLSDAEADYVLATHDPLAAMASADAGALDALLSSVNSGEAAVQQMLAELAEGAGLYQAREEVDAEPQVDKADELREKWGTERGQVWQLGEHRLMCGDSTSAEDVARLMGGEKATLAPVDPPYNVGFDYDGKTVNDTKDADEYERFSRAWFSECQRASTRQITTPGCYNLALWVKWFDPYHVAPWTKTAAMTNGRVSRFWCWEPVLFFGSEWKRSRPNDVFHFEALPQKMAGGKTLTGVHPCPKPLAMWVDLIENYSDKGDVIYEAFSGSGTTLIACEQLGRKCRAMEISPAYVAVALERWAQATGKTPELIEYGTPD